MTVRLLITAVLLIVVLTTRFGLHPFLSLFFTAVLYGLLTGMAPQMIRLAKTILYTLNPRDQEVFASIAGSFQGDTLGKVRYGAAWWFLDQMDGILKQLETLSSIGLLSQSIGMLTDSRSILSYPRHEYFRRILCNLLGSDMTRGFLPDDLALIGGMVRDICYNNARRYFGFPAL